MLAQLDGGHGRKRVGVVRSGNDNRVDVSMVDVFARKGVRFRGPATFHAMDSEQAAALRPRISAKTSARAAPPTTPMASKRY